MPDESELVDHGGRQYQGTRKPRVNDGVNKNVAPRWADDPQTQDPLESRVDGARDHRSPDKDLLPIRYAVGWPARASQMRARGDRLRSLLVAV